MGWGHCVDESHLTEGRRISGDCSDLAAMGSE